MHAAFEEIDRIQGLMSVRKETSEVALMNRDGFCEDVSVDTRYVIQQANCYAEMSGGAFDVTILPIVQLWERAALEGKFP